MMSQRSNNKSHNLAATLRRAIREGKWAEGVRLPGMRELAGQFNSSVPTVQNAIRLLEGEGLVRCHSRRGAFVRSGAEAPGRRAAEEPGVGPHIGLIGTKQSMEAYASDEWSWRILRAVEAGVMEGGRFYLTRIYSAQGDRRRNVEELIEQTEHLAGQMGGAIIFPGAFGPIVALMERLDRLGVPWVSINHPTEQVIYNFVSADNIAAGKTAGRCFLANGFERIVILSPPLAPLLSWTQKAMGLFEAYLHAERPTGGIAYVRCEGVEEAAGYRAMLEHLERAGAPQGVFAIGDPLAIGAMRACREKGLAVPGEVSVIGSTGIHAGELCSPALTVVAQPMEAMGAEAARMLLRMIQTGERRLPGRQIAGALVVRESLKLEVPARRRLAEAGIQVEGDGSEGSIPEPVRAADPRQEISHA